MARMPFLIKSIYAGFAAFFQIIFTPGMPIGQADIAESCKMTVAHAAISIGLGSERGVILAAADRNGCNGDDLLILLAIRKSENGRPGREFGIIHPKCEKQMKKHPSQTLDIQAGWAAATIVKNRVRWELAGKPGGPGGFITYLADRYCPASTDPTGNKNWIHNVNFWFDKLEGLTK
jgi:hypothetical protein